MASVQTETAQSPAISRLRPKADGIMYVLSQAAHPGPTLRLTIIVYGNLILYHL